MFESLLKYTAYVDQKIIQVFERNQNCGDRAVLLFSHVLNAQHVWIKRILKEEEMYGVWEIHIPQKFQSIHLNNIQLLTKIWDNVALNLDIVYLNSKGNHSTYHRGQIISMFKGAGIIPPSTDYIMAKREGFV